MTDQHASPFYDSIEVDLKPAIPSQATSSAEPAARETPAAEKPATATVKTAKPETKPETRPVTRPESDADSIWDEDLPDAPKPGLRPEDAASPKASEGGGVRFADLGLDQRVLDAISAEGYETPTPIQARCIAPAIAGKDILGCAQTGTGKTAAFSLPLLHRLVTSTKRPVRKPATPHKKNGNTTKRIPRALVLSPTRELADQIADSLKAYGCNTGLRGTVIYGGVKQFRQVKSLQRGVDILVATPGRLLDLMDQGHVDLSNIEVFVLDEADRMLDMGFIHPIRKIAQAFVAKPQTLLFSATMPKPIAQLADTLLTNPEKITVNPVSSAVPLIEQSLYLVDGGNKATLLIHMLQCHTVERAVVFIRTKHGAENLANKLEKAGIRAESIHGNKNQNQRNRALDSFRSGRSRVLVATDVAARGLDVDGITHVYNFSIPNEPEAYVHRIGRTGRAGSTGKAVAFCARDERGDLYAIERLIKTTLDASPLPEELDLPEEPPLKRKMPSIGAKPEFKGRKGRKAPRPEGDRPRRGQANGGKPNRGKPDGDQAQATGGGKKKRARRGPAGAHGSHSAQGGKSGHQPAGGRAKKSKSRR